MATLATNWKWRLMAMATPKKAVEKKTASKRATGEKLLQLALALRAVLDEVTDIEAIRALDVYEEAKRTLTELGFGSLVGIPRQVAALTAQAEAAVKSGEFGKAAELYGQIEKVKAGKLQIALPPPSE